MRVTAWLVVILFVGIRPSFWNPGPTELLATMRTCAVVTIGVFLILAANCFSDSARTGCQWIDVAEPAPQHSRSGPRPVSLEY